MSKRSKYSKNYICTSGIRTVAAGHKMVAEGWALFEEAVSGAGEGDLPQLLRSLKGMTTPTPTPPPGPTPPPQGTPPPVQMDVDAPLPSPSRVKKEGGTGTVIKKSSQKLS